jgi:hypothetical protein
MRLPASAQADRVHNLCDALRLSGERFRHLTLQIRIDHTIQVHDVIQSLYLDLIRRLQDWMLIKQCAHFGRDFSVAGATAEPAFSVCRTSRKSARQNEREGQCV